jgi:hypothetical protein
VVAGVEDEPVAELALFDDIRVKPLVVYAHGGPPIGFV